MKALQWIRDWALIIAMVVGVASYFAYEHMPFMQDTHAFANQVVAVAQPVLIFCMLFLTFCKVNPRRIHLCRWHLWLLLIQCGIFAGVGLWLTLESQSSMRVVMEGVMICLICPTATAAPVITRKLGGDVAHITTYTILINLSAAVLIPVMLPYVHPHHGMSVLNASMLILGKVFPLLLMPLVLAWLLRFTLPKVCHKISRWQEVSFYLWVVALALAMAVTTRSIVHSSVGLSTMAWLVVVSLASCVGQFWLGRKIGGVYDDKVTAGQAMGQKNTVLAIWLGYTFFTPITSIVGGFYSIWHNVINSFQLYRHRRVEKQVKRERL